MVRGRHERDTCRDFVIPALAAVGWTSDRVVEQYRMQNPAALHVQRDADGELRIADYVLEVTPGFPIGVLEAKREYRHPADGIQQALDYARRLDLPFAFSTNGHGFVRHDLDGGAEREIAELPTPEELWSEFLDVRGAGPELGALLTVPFERSVHLADQSVKQPRYYQRTAVHRALTAIHGGADRVLLLMATGTGKTFTALQLVHKLRTHARQVDPDRSYRVLYLADRDFLIRQPMERDFRTAFGDAVTRLRAGNVSASRDIYFATYQALDADVTGEDPDATPAAFFTEYPADFFDLVIVDECHRGSASQTSSWRGILDHFTSAVQIGLTATPKRDANVDTYEYFGPPVFEYSLREGIEDGYLAPYRVRRVVLDIDAHGWAPGPGQRDRFGREIPAEVYTTREFERLVSVLDRTETVARHLVTVLAADPGAKAIIFCVDAEHAQQMRQALINADPARSAREPEWAVRIVGTEPEKDRLLEQFVDPERDIPAVATTARLLSTGIDVEDLKYVVLFRPVGSMVEFKQIIGRGTRLYPDKGKFHFEVIDYVGAAAKFDDPEFDGPPLEPPRRERITLDGEVVVDEADRAAESDDNSPALPDLVDEDLREVDSPAESRLADLGRKLYVDGIEVQRIGETFRVLDPQTGQLTTVEYSVFVGDKVRSMFVDPEDLRGAWSHGVTRGEVADQLATRGILLSQLAEITGLSEADPLDILFRAAWDIPPRSRRERAQRVQETYAKNLASLTTAARSVLEVLLERYATGGIDELDSRRALLVPPLTELGTPAEIAASFGGREQYWGAMEDLQEWLYAA